MISKGTSCVPVSAGGFQEVDAPEVLSALRMHYYCKYYCYS